MAIIPNKPAQAAALRASFKDSSKPSFSAHQISRAVKLGLVSQQAVEEAGFSTSARGRITGKEAKRFGQLVLKGA